MKSPIPIFKLPPVDLSAVDLMRWLTQRAHETQSSRERALCISLIDDLALAVESYQAGDVLAAISTRG